MLKKYYSKMILSTIYDDKMILNSRCNLKLMHFKNDLWEEKDVEKYFATYRQQFMINYDNKTYFDINFRNENITKYYFDIFSNDINYQWVFFDRSIKHRRCDYDRYMKTSNDFILRFNLF